DALRPPAARHRARHRRPDRRRSRCGEHAPAARAGNRDRARRQPAPRRLVRRSRPGLAVRVPALGAGPGERHRGPGASGGRARARRTARRGVARRRRRGLGRDGSGRARGLSRENQEVPMAERTLALEERTGWEAAWNDALTTLELDVARAEALLTDG